MTDDAVEFIGSMTADHPGMRNLYGAFVEATNIEPDDLTYEDWVRPMKLTGGRVCLRLDLPGWDADVFVSRRGDGMLIETADTDEFAPFPTNPTALKNDIEKADTVEPVLREDTPFGGEGDGD